MTPMVALPLGPVFWSRPALLSCEVGEPDCDSEALSGKIKVLPGLLFHTAPPWKLIEVPTAPDAVPKLSTTRALSVEGNAAAREEVPLRMVWPAPLIVPLVQVKEPLTVTLPVPVR